MISTGDAYRAEAEEKLTEGQKVFDLVKNRPSHVFQKVTDILTRVPADGDETGRKNFNFGLLRKELEEILASVQGSTDTSIILAITAFVSAQTYNGLAGLADILEAQVGIEAIRENRKKRSERMTFSKALNMAAARGDWKEHDRLVDGYQAELSRKADDIIAGDGSVGSGESSDEGAPT